MCIKVALEHRISYTFDRLVEVYPHVVRLLRFELVDSVTGMSRGGCTYHVSHPGGRSYDAPPVNAVEAESRRGRRFESTGFTPGTLDMSDIREKQARQSTDVGAAGILDMRRVRTVLQ
jgi:uncharacterized protein (DUF2126 family)